MKLSVPSKTFICGEYNVLFGGKGILISTDPSFIVDESQVIYDPYNGSGGFGLSGALFLGRYLCDQTISDINIRNMLNVFKVANPKQSGSDIVSQYFGHITIIDKDNYKTISWPFHTHELLIFKTNSKVDTYKNLSDIPELDTTIMNRYVNEVECGLLDKDIELLAKGMNNFYEYLKTNNLVSATSKELVNRIKSCCNVLAVKGCGTLCNDVIIVLCNSALVNDIKLFAAEIGIKYIASSNDIRGGTYVVC